MTINELHKKLLEAYTVKNLNNISLTLINLYKNQQFSILQKITELIGDTISIQIMDDGKGFSKLMMLYHPDRAEYHTNEINKLSEQGNFDGLLEYSHILKLERIEEIAAALDSYEDIDYSPVYDWDINTEGFRIVTDSEQDDDTSLQTKKVKGYTFYDAKKIREYGHTHIEFPTYYLEDIEEFELSSSEINDLDGVQFCIHTKILDVSDNQINDLSPLIGLKQLEELNISYNQIGYIDVLGNLTNLRSVNLSNNFIDDISPLFELEKLEYVDLSGNKVGPAQINLLKEAGITVDC
jgi:Leucine-rich repeat (LRR) protein